MQLLNFIIYFVLGTNAKQIHQESSFYKMVTIAGGKGCVDALVQPAVALRFGARNGTCKDQNCTILTGSKRIPFCCNVNGYKCEI